MNKYFLAAALLLLTACSGSKYEGKWRTKDGYLFIHDDGVFDAVIRSQYYTGTWSDDKQDLLSLESYDGHSLSFFIDKTEDEEMKVTDYNTKKKYVFTRQKQVSVSSKYNYWEASKNWWRIAPAQSENNEQLCARTKAALQSAIDYLTYCQQQPQGTFWSTAITVPVYVASNGVRIEGKAGQAWTGSFYSAREAAKAHKMLVYAINGNLEIDKNLEGVDLAVSIMSDLNRSLDDGKKQLEDLENLGLGRYDTPQLNKWAEKPVKPETASQLRDRLVNCIEYSIAYIYTEGLNNAYTPYEKLPLPLQFGNNGVMLRNELPYTWSSMFYNDSDALQAYHMFKEALLYEVEVPTTTKNEVLNIQILQRLLAVLTNENLT